MPVKFYCVKCRKPQETSTYDSVTMKNGKPAKKAKCPACGTTMFKIGLTFYLPIRPSPIRLRGGFCGIIELSGKSGNRPAIKRSASRERIVPKGER